VSKLPCTLCGVPILPATAAGNDGLCMPCARGTTCAQCGKRKLSLSRVGLCSVCRPPVSSPPRPQYASIEAWLESTVPEKTPEDVVAYNFNLAEGGCWIVEVIGASSFDSRTGDWACPPEAWSCRPSQFEIPYDWAANWQDAAKYVASHVTNFILRSSHPGAEVLRQAEAVCVGFVDGDLTRIWPRPHPLRA
jgi:hypothetical protein